MDWLQILANVAQIIGVIWVLLFGGRALFEVIQRLRQKRPFKVEPYIITNILLALILIGVSYISLNFLTVQRGDFPALPVGTAPPFIQQTALTTENAASPFSKGKLVFDDSLQDNAHGHAWQSSTEGHGACTFANGSYLVNAEQAPNTSGSGRLHYCFASAISLSTQPFAYQAQMIFLHPEEQEGPAGLAFAITPQKCLLFALYDTGQYQLDLYNPETPQQPPMAITNDKRSLQQFVAGIHWDDTKPIMMQVIATKTTIMLYVNRLFVTTVSMKTDEGAIQGSIGVFASVEDGVRTEVAFTDAKIWLL